LAAAPAGAVGRYFETLDPANEQSSRTSPKPMPRHLCRGRLGSPAFEGEWGHTRAADRGNALLRLADLIRQNRTR